MKYIYKNAGVLLLFSTILSIFLKTSKNYQLILGSYLLVITFAVISILKLINERKSNPKSKYILLFASLILTTAICYYFLYAKT